MDIPYTRLSSKYSQVGIRRNNSCKQKSTSQKQENKMCSTYTQLAEYIAYIYY